MTCALCFGVGSISHVTHHENGCVEHWTSLCGCREVQPVREGKAQWWTLETAFERTVDIPIGHESALVEVHAEVPVDAENNRVQRRGNRWYPSLIDVDFGSAELTLHPHTARELAQALLDAADASDAVDLPDTEPACGHWAPCDCPKASEANAK